jgi:GTP-binding protein
MITGPEPGLTRDAVAVEWRDATGGRVRLVDTAGLRRRARVRRIWRRCRPPPPSPR